MESATDRRPSPPTRVSIIFTNDPAKYAWGNPADLGPDVRILSVIRNPRVDDEYVVVYEESSDGIDLEGVFAAVRREERYARGWGSNRPDGKKDHFTDARTRRPYRPMDWIAFAEKYIADAKLAWANYTPDERGVTVRMIKAAYLLLAGVSVNHTSREVESLGGYSSNRYPILHGGLDTKNLFAQAEEEVPSRQDLR